MICVCAVHGHQRYVTNPMLLDGYKFDLRIYVLVTSFSPLEAFLYKVRCRGVVGLVSAHPTYAHVAC